MRTNITGVLLGLSVVCLVVFGACLVVDADAALIPITHSTTIEDPGDYYIANDDVQSIIVKANNVSINGVDPDGVQHVISPTGGVGILLGEDSSLPTILNFTARNLVVHSPGMSGDQLLWLFDTRYGLFEDCTFSVNSAPSTEILECQYTNDTVFRRCVFYAPMKSKSTLRSESYRLTFDHCSFISLDSGSTGVIVAGGSGEHTFSHCTFNGGALGLYFMAGATRSDVINCLIIGGYHLQEQVMGGGETWNFYSNTVVGSFYYDNPSVPVQFRNNLIAGKKYGSWPSDDENNLWAYYNDSRRYDPSLYVGFVDAADGDYSLMEDSPAVGIGHDGYISWPLDHNGNPRVVGHLDVGANEYQGGTIPIGAGCTETSTCQMSVEEWCSMIGGIWFEGESCDPTPCPSDPPPSGKCCLTDGTCLYESVCNGTSMAVGGWREGVVCLPNPCKQPDPPPPIELPDPLPDPPPDATVPVVQDTIRYETTIVRNADGLWELWWRQ